ncbi:MAG: PDZ domain-containing protein, partial [Elusimicrobiota bacterium]
MNNKTMILHSKCFKSTKKLIALIIAIVFFNGCTTSYYYSIDRLYYPSKQIAKDTLFPIKLQIGPIITSNADVYELTNNNYTVKFTQNDIQYGFRKILFNELRANRLFDEVELVKTVTDTKGDVGIILVKTNDIYKVFYVIDASPASKSGILPGDELISIDGQTIDNMNILQLYDKLRGPRGSSVKICIERNDKVQEFVIQRAKVPVLSKRYDYTHEPGNLILLTQLNKAPVSRSSNDEIGATIGYIMLGAAIFTGLIIIGIATSNSDIVSVLSQALSFPRPNIKADVVEEEITDRLNFKFWVFDAVTGDIVTEI